MTTPNDTAAVWLALAAPLDMSLISWRIDSKPTQRDGKYFARFVAYIDAHTVRERLDSVVPGEWDVTLAELAPQLLNGDGEVMEEPFAFKARLQVLGVVREDVGTGRDYKTAATDALKRAAVRFGIGAELYDMEPNWVQVDGDGKFAKPVEDPGDAYARRKGQARAASRPAISAQRGGDAGVSHQGGRPGVASGGLGPPSPDESTSAPAATTPGEFPPCPKCSGRMWDNRVTKRNPKAPDFKCRDETCDGVIWPARARVGSAASIGDIIAQGSDELPKDWGDDHGDGLPF